MVVKLITSKSKILILRVLEKLSCKYKKKKPTMNVVFNQINQFFVLKTDSTYNMSLKQNNNCICKPTHNQEMSENVHYKF